MMTSTAEAEAELPSDKEKEDVQLNKAIQVVKEKMSK